MRAFEIYFSFKKKKEKNKRQRIEKWRLNKFLYSRSVPYRAFYTNSISVTHIERRARAPRTHSSLPSTSLSVQSWLIQLVSLSLLHLTTMMTCATSWVESLSWLHLTSNLSEEADAQIPQHLLLETGPLSQQNVRSLREVPAVWDLDAFFSSRWLCCIKKQKCNTQSGVYRSCDFKFLNERTKSETNMLIKYIFSNQKMKLWACRAFHFSTAQRG